MTRMTTRDDRVGCERSDVVLQGRGLEAYSRVHEARSPFAAALQAREWSDASSLLALVVFPLVIVREGYNAREGVGRGRKGSDASLD